MLRFCRNFLSDAGFCRNSPDFKHEGGITAPGRFPEPRHTSSNSCTKLAHAAPHGLLKPLSATCENSVARRRPGRSARARRGRCSRTCASASPGSPRASRRLEAARLRLGSEVRRALPQKAGSCRQTALKKLKKACDVQHGPTTALLGGGRYSTEQALTRPRPHARLRRRWRWPRGQCG